MTWISIWYAKASPQCTPCINAALEARRWHAWMHGAHAVELAKLNQLGRMSWDLLVQYPAKANNHHGEPRLSLELDGLELGLVMWVWNSTWWAEQIPDVRVEGIHERSFGTFMFNFSCFRLTVSELIA